MMMQNKKLSLTLISLLLLGQGVWAENITVSTADGLMAIATNVNNGTKTYSGDVITLTDDIDLSGKTWVPIGNDWDTQKRFKGTFDGGGHTISNLSITTEDKYYLGVFGCVEGGTVKNLVLANSTITSSVNSSSYTDYVGGIVGYNLGGTIENCWVLPTVTIQGDDHVGGIVGYSGTSGTNIAYIKNCYNFGATVTDYTTGEPKGTICGKNEGETITDGITLNGLTLYKDGYWNTLCLPFSISSFSGTPLAGAEVKTLTSASLENHTLKLTFGENLTAIEAGKPYIVKWATGENVVNPTFSGVTFSTVLDPITSGGITFTGQLTPFTIDASNIDKIVYLGAEDVIGYASKYRVLHAFRCHFVVPTASGTRAMTRSIIDFGDGTTAIQNQGVAISPSPWFTLDGRRLSGAPSVKGVYIHHGKKIIIQ
ncbi:MAG: hypothetical protein IKX44_00895 [Prevotella sp.]|nr:hypothetical protein [Prevotella sp.]